MNTEAFDYSHDRGCQRMARAMSSKQNSHKPLQRVTCQLLTGVLLVLAGCAAPKSRHPEEKVYDDVVFASPGGHELRMDLYVPKSEKPVPVVVWIFGGSW